ncbi:hypothetical protein K502DRAFT_302307 [Neoconidiobolus thromboides FSU 785]|nr:hypothetical protein K502DRAFT_302307 [Neoconidiobolus thromboides FSU 785]
MSLPIGYSTGLYSEKSDVSRPILTGNTLRIFSPTNKIRRFLAYLLRSEIIEVFLTLIVILHFLTLATTTKSISSTDNGNFFGASNNIILPMIFIIYTLESFARIIVGGLIYDGIKYPKKNNKEYINVGLNDAISSRIYSTRSAYLRKSFNRLDLFCIISFWIFKFTTFSHLKGYALGIIVSLSSLRIFRLLNFASSSQVILKSLKTSGPLLINVFTIIAFFLLAYSIIGTTFYQDSLKYKCFELNDPNDINSGYKEEPTIFDQICGSYLVDDITVKFPSSEIVTNSFSDARATGGYTCPVGQICAEMKDADNRQTGFHTMFRSFIYVFIIGTGQSWSDIMYSVFYGTSSGASVYFISLIIAINFWLLNMFVAVISQVFGSIRSNQISASIKKKPIDLIDEVNKHNELENHYEDVGRITSTRDLEKEAATSPLTTKSKSYGCFDKKTLYTINKYFWLLLIAVNLGVLGSKNSHTSDNEVRMLEISETVINCLFFIEIILRYFLSSQFFKKAYNIFDASLAIINLVVTMINLASGFESYKYFTIFQVVRTYRLVWMIPIVRSLLMKIASGIQAIGNMVLFVFTLIFLCSAIAIQLFGGLVPEKDGDDEIFQRFDSFGWSFLALYQVFSGEDWSKVLYILLDSQKDLVFSVVAVIFIFMFFALSNFILVNLFVAVLVENLELSDKEKRRIQLENYFNSLQLDIKRINNYLSPWNIYKYIKPDPQKLKVHGIPDSLILDLKAFDAEQFLKHYKQKSEKVKHKSSLMERIEKFNFKEVIKMDHFNKKANKHLAMDSVNEETVHGRLLTFIAQNDTQEPKVKPYGYEQLSLQREEFMEVHPTYDKSFFLFSRSSRLRRICQMISGSHDHPNYPFPSLSFAWILQKFYFVFMVISVIVNIGFTLFQTPKIMVEIDSGGLSNPFIISDAIFLIIFGVDVAIHAIADGLLFTPNAYLQNFWNIPYFIALVISFIDYYAKFSKAEGLSRFARAGKSLRVLRLINFSNTAKFTLDAVLVSGFSKLFEAALIALSFLIPWSIYLQNVFRGLFYSCNDDNVSGVTECIGEFVNPSNGLTTPRVWANPWKYSFDSFSSALNILFQITSGEGWTDVMQNSMKVKGLGLQPESYVSWYHSFIIITFNFMVSVSVLSLFVSVIIDNFTTRSGSALLSSEQRRWKDFEKIIKNIKPSKLRETAPKNQFVAYCHELATTKKTWFTKFMGVIYFLIFVTLATERSGMSTKELYIKAIIFVVLTSICAAEVVIKIIGLKANVYFRNLSNILYFALVTSTLALCVIRFAMIDSRHSHNVVNLFLIFISLRLMSMFDGLHQLFLTLKASAKSILNLLFVWVILFLVYAVCFIQVFGNTKVGVNGTESYVNFYTPLNTLLLLVRFSQGEGWNSVMYDFTTQAPECVIDNKSNFLTSDCGSPAWSYFLFMSFNILSMYIFLNMFVGVIVDNFSFCYEINDEKDGEATTTDMLSRDQIRDYKSAWIKYDLKRSEYIPLRNLVPFLMKLKEPFECKIYNKIYSISNLVECSKFNNPSSNKDGAYNQEAPNLKVLNSLLRTMSERECKEKKLRLNRIYHELRLLIKPGRGIHFNDALSTLSREMLIDPLSSFEISDLIKYNKLKEEVLFQMHMEKVIGLLQTFVLRRKFLAYLQEKREKEAVKSPTLQINIISPNSNEKSTDSIIIASPLSIHPSTSFYSLSGDSSHSNISMVSTEEMDQETASSYIQQLNSKKWKDLMSKK